MKKSIILSVAILMVFVATTACTNSSRPEVQTESIVLPLRRLAIPKMEQQKKGLKEPIPRQERVFSDQESWAAFWKSHGVDDPPVVMFSSEEVVAVFMGPRGSPGYDVQITKVLYEPTGPLKKVLITEYLPNPNKSHLGIVVHPADLVAFPRRPGEVVFERVEVVRSD